MHHLPDLVARISNMRRVVIESPCAASDISNFGENADYLQEALEDSIRRNEAPIASHGLFAFTHFFDDADADQRSDCMLAGWAWLPSAHAVVAYCDLGISPGMQQAIELAASMHVPVFYRYLRADPNDDRLFSGTFRSPRPGTPGAPEEKQGPDE